MVPALRMVSSRQQSHHRSSLARRARLGSPARLRTMVRLHFFPHLCDGALSAIRKAVIESCIGRKWQVPRPRRPTIFSPRFVRVSQSVVCLASFPLFLEHRESGLMRRCSTVARRTVDSGISFHIRGSGIPVCYATLRYSIVIVLEHCLPVLTCPQRPCQ